MKGLSRDDLTALALGKSLCPHHCVRRCHTHMPIDNTQPIYNATPQAPLTRERGKSPKGGGGAPTCYSQLEVPAPARQREGGD